MIIENVDTLKAWLIKTLEPICDADPAALAKYVIALAKKDKPQPELRALCEDQLDVFLGDETKEFVSELFDTLINKSYMQQQLQQQQQQQQQQQPSVVPAKKIEVPEIKTEEEEEEEPKGTKRKSFEEAGKPEKSNESEKVQKTDKTPDVGKIRALESDKENVILKTTVKKEVDYDNAPEITQPKNNAEKLDKDKPLRMSTRQSVKKELEVEPEIDNISMRSVSVDRSVKSMSPAVRTRHETRHSSRRKSSRSPARSGGRHTRSSRRDRPRREHHERTREPRTTRRKEKEKCRDYEEKGFCMLGEVCPYDHGYDPVEVDDRNLPQMLTLAGLPAPQSNPGQLLIPNVLPAARPLAPLSSGLPSLNTGLTTVQVQNARPIPSPAEIPNHQVPIFRPRNPIAFIRNLSPAGAVTPVTPVSQPVITPPVALPMAKTTDDLPKTTNNAYNPEDPAIEVGVANSLKNAMKTQSLPTVNNYKNELKKDDEKTDKSNNEDKTKTATVDEDNRTQDELVAIAMGNVPLTPIVGSQPNNVFNVNSNIVNSSQPPVQAPVVLQGNAYRPEVQVQPTFLPMSLTVQQQYHQLQIQQHQQAAALAAQQQQQQQALQTLVQNNAKPYRKNTVLELRKIPAQLNNIIRLSEFFQKFGIITRVQTPYDNDVQAALIEYSQYQEAVAAYNCPEAILGNRFIKMFWHNPNRPKSQNPVPSGGGGEPNVPPPRHQHQHQHQQHQHQHQHQEMGHRPPVEVRPRKIPSSEDLIYRNPKTDPKLMQIEKKKELDKLKMELLKKKQTHYEELAKKQKEILAKLEKENLTKEEKARLFKAFKHADAAVTKLRKELYEEANSKAVVAPVRNIADAKKAILDKEIDIYHGNLDGEELIEAKKALATLKREANLINPGPRGGRGGFRGRGRGWFQSGGVSVGGRGRGRGRGATFTIAPSERIIDNRPKQMLVSGYDLEEKDEVVAHFATFGQLDRIEEHENNKMKLTFPTRKAAEIAAMQGRTFRGKQLVLSWFTPPVTNATQVQPPIVERQMTRSLSQSLMDKDLDDDLLELDKEEEEMLLADVEDDDDEDDVESDERSWRR